MDSIKTIMMTLSTYPSVVLSWGFSQFGILKEDTGIIFHVQGYKFNGWVKVIYDEGADLFNVVFQSNEGEIIQEKKGIYLDGLVNTIDEYVEKTDDYNERIKEQYWVVVLKPVES
jgi:hypothetical protein